MCCFIFYFFLPCLEENSLICKFFSMEQNNEKTGHEIQSSTMELINGLVSLVHQTTMPDVTGTAMEALLMLHQPEKIQMWNPEAPINTFWDVRSLADARRPLFYPMLWFEPGGCARGLASFVVVWTTH